MVEALVGLYAVCRPLVAESTTGAHAGDNDDADAAFAEDHAPRSFTTCGCPSHVFVRPRAAATILNLVLDSRVRSYSHSQRVGRLFVRILF
jgi:hypothetical protein